MPHYKFSDLAYNITDKKMPEPGDEKTYIGLEHLDSGSLAVTRWGGEIELKGQKLVMKKGDILFGRRNTYLRRAAIAPHDGIFSAHGMVFRPKTEVIDPDYFPFFIASDYFMNAAIRISVGSLSPTVNWKTLKELEFDIPTLEQQRESAKILKAANELKESYQELLLKTDDLVKSQFIGDIQRAFDEGRVTTLGKMVEADRPITYGIVKPGHGCPGGVPVVKVKDMQDGVIDESNLLLTTPELDYQYRRSRLRAGDLLISIRGSVGRLAEIPESLENANITQDTARLTISPQYNKIYVRGVLESPILQWDMEKNIRGVAVKGINIGYLRELKMPVCDRERQDELARLYKQSDKSKFELKQAIEGVDLLIKSMIQQELN